MQYGMLSDAASIPLKNTCVTNSNFSVAQSQIRTYSPDRSYPMETTRPKVPAEAIALYNVFIHGGMSRRAFMDGIKKIAVGTMAASAMVEALMPNYAAAQQISPTDNRIKASYETVPSPNGNGSIKGYFVRPMSADTRNEKPSKLPGIIVIHENRGLNPHIEDIARRLAMENFMTFAPDGLTSLGGFPGDDYKGGLMFNKIDKAKMTEDMIAAAKWLKARPDCTGVIGVTGFCYGGSMSNTLAVKLGPDLAGSWRNGLDYFLENIIDPNAVVGDNFQLHVLTKKDGSVISGVIEQETDTAITARTVTESVIISKADLKDRQKMPVSLMPPGLLESMPERKALELLKFLLSKRE